MEWHLRCRVWCNWTRATKSVAANWIWLCISAATARSLLRLYTQPPPPPGQLRPADASNTLAKFYLTSAHQGHLSFMKFNNDSSIRYIECCCPIATYMAIRLNTPCSRFFYFNYTFCFSYLSRLGLLHVLLWMLKWSAISVFLVQQCCKSLLYWSKKVKEARFVKYVIWLHVFVPNEWHWYSDPE